MIPAPVFRLFGAYGIELEYMIVDGERLDVHSISDRVLEAQAGVPSADAEHGEITWSNELVLHVLEFKTTHPVPSLDGLAAKFQASIRRANELLAPMGGRLMPTGMHPWMRPDAETSLWPHDNGEIYSAFDRIFGARGHGWANLQSVHLNLPFADDEEFGRLHAAIRLILPIVPAIAASSPICEGRLAGALDHRLVAYRSNSRRIPSVAGSVIPEPVFTRAEYERAILQRIYEDMRPLDSQGILRHEWINARGAIARFCRNTIEIRVIDAQECPLADLAIVMAVARAVRALVEEIWISGAAQKAWRTEPLEAIFLSTITLAERAVIDDAAYLEALGFKSSKATAGELWRHLIESASSVQDPAVRELEAALDSILDAGPLARRIVRAIDGDDSRAGLGTVYRRLADCLRDGELFSA